MRGVCHCFENRTNSWMGNTERRRLLRCDASEKRSLFRVDRERKVRNGGTADGTKNKSENYGDAMWRYRETKASSTSTVDRRKKMDRWRYGNGGEIRGSA